MEELILNSHNKEEFPPAHTAEHLLNQTMKRMFGCERSRNAHIERKKSKISFVTRDTLPDDVSLDRLPDDASEAIRLVRIGDYDVCPCIGKHVRSTSQIGRFELLGTNWDELSHSFRIRFKVVQ